MADQNSSKTTGPMADSRFNMWRSVFAIAHADHVVTSQERSFMYKILDEQPFTAEQRNTLEEDVKHAQDIAEIFIRITDQHDRSDFFRYARSLVWCDGDFGEQEQRIMLQLQTVHYEKIDFDKFEKTMDFDIDEEERDMVRETRAMIEQTVNRSLWQKIKDIF